MELILPINATAAKVLFPAGTQPAIKTHTLSLVGLVTTETVSIEIPRVLNPDVTNDAHWTAMKWDGAAVTLSVDNNVIRIPAHLLVRLNKAAGVSSNAYGVRWS